MAEQISYLKELIDYISEFIYSSAKLVETFEKLFGHLDVMNAFVIEYSKIDTDNNHHLQQLAADVRYMVCRAEAASEKLIIFRTSQQRFNVLSIVRHLFLWKNQMQDVSAKVAILLKERALPELEALKIGVADNKGEMALVVEEDNGVGFEDEAKTVIELLTGESKQLEIVSITEMLQKIKPCDPVFKAFYVRFLKEIKLNQLNSLLLGQIIQIFLDRLLENLVDILKEDFHILQQSLMFLISFLANAHDDQHAEDEEQAMVTAEIEVLVKEDMFLVLSVDDSKSNARLSDFTRKVQLLKGKVQQVYDQMRDSFSYDSPKTSVLGFFNFLLQNLRLLKEKLKRDADFIPFAEHLIIEIEEELSSLRPYLDDLFEQQREQNELKDTWLKVIDLAYQTEYAINSCSVVNHQLWYNMARLFGVLDKIKAVKSKLKNIEGIKTHDRGVLHCSAIAPNEVLEDPWPSSFSKELVDLKGEVTKIVTNLIRGSRSLDIVAIVGMAGLGKTTHANKVYHDPAVRQHFHVFAYCVVTQVHNARNMLLLSILCDIIGKDDKMYDMVEEDLADMLCKCLKGKRYLILMDDIWHVKAWDDVRRSLPDDGNGSRVLFTTRVHNVALQAKDDCILHHLRFLSEEESWELLRRKVFHEEACPPDFSEVGKMIAKNCNGLPLTVVLIGGILSRTERTLTWWNKVSETISSYVSTEGGMDVLEFSYQHLPEHLKSCFLYFCAFAEDAVIHVNKLTLLWIAEGFMQNSNMEKLKNVTKDFLRELVDRSLVIANKRVLLVESKVAEFMI